MIKGIVAELNGLDVCIDEDSRDPSAHMRRIFKPYLTLSRAFCQVPLPLKFPMFSGSMHLVALGPEHTKEYLESYRVARAFNPEKYTFGRDVYEYINEVVVDPQDSSGSSDSSELESPTSPLPSSPDQQHLGILSGDQDATDEETKSADAPEKDAYAWATDFNQDNDSGSETIDPASSPRSVDSDDSIAEDSFIHDEDADHDKLDESVPDSEEDCANDEAKKQAVNVIIPRRAKRNIPVQDEPCNKLCRK